MEAGLGCPVAVGVGGWIADPWMRPILFMITPRTVALYGVIHGSQCFYCFRYEYNFLCVQFLALTVPITFPIESGIHSYDFMGMNPMISWE